MISNRKSDPHEQSRFGEEELRLLNKMFEGAPVYMAVLEGPDHRIQYINKHLQDLYGNRPFSLGIPAREYWTELTDQYIEGKNLFDIMDQIYATGEPFMANEFMVEVDRNNSGTLEKGYFNFIYQPLKDDQDKDVYGIFISGYEVTEHVEAVKREMFFEKRLEIALKAAEMGFWEIDPNDYSLKYSSSQCKILFGFSPDQEVTMKNIFEAVHPEDRDRVKEELINAVEETGNYDIEHRVCHPDGSIHWIMARGHYLQKGNQPHYLTGITLDITEHKETQRKLKEAVAMRDEFLSIAAHELQTPVTSIKVRGELFERQLQGSDMEEYTKQAKKINTHINQLSKLTGRLLDVSRIKEGKLQLERKTFTLNELLEDTVEALQPLSHHKIYLEQETKKQVNADRNRIRQVVTNMLSNAIKYSPEADRVIVRISDGNDEEVYVSVIDFGIGIPEEDHQKVFRRFFKGESVERQTYPGFGIGLYISAQIIQYHNGRIWVDDNPEGGSIFTFSLPTDTNN